MPREGSHISRFRLLRLLGRGGMGEVYLAEDEQLRRHVAIKVIQADTPDADATRLFLREARAIAMLSHPHILPLFDFGEATIVATTLANMVMPFCQEGTLATWMQQHCTSGLLSFHVVGSLIQQAASALQYAHTHQIVHQDVKPSNFLIRSREDSSGPPDLLLADFGVARSTSATATMSQTVRGTPAYMAPEQWDGIPVPATDQYALAILAYDLVTGHPPFQGGLGQVMYQHLHVKPQPPSARNPRLPADVDTVLLHALAKQPEERFSSISAFAHAFQQALAGDFSSPTVADTLREPGRSDIYAALTISEAEALAGTHRLITIRGGRQVPVTLPAGTQDGQIIRLEGQVEAASDRDEPGALILTITVAPPEEQAHEAFADGEVTVMSSSSESDTKGAVELAPQGLLQEQTRRSVSATHAQGAGAIPPPSPATVGTETVQHRRGLSKGRAILLVGLALLVVGGSIGFFFFTKSNQPSPSPAFGTLALDDPLSDNSHGYRWEENNDTYGTCAFREGAYQVNAIHGGGTKFCQASNTTFSDFAYEVQITIVQGERGGIVFRNDKTKGKSYYFSIGQDGTYALWLFICTSPSFDSCYFSGVHDGSSPAITTGLNQTNLIAVVAKGNTIDLYVNNQRINSVSDSSSSQGQIGVAVSDVNGPPSEVVFRDAKVWT
jgi:eukaryotic-like serine/threonine-protein kinase